MLKGLFTTITNVNFNSDTVKKLSDEIRRRSRKTENQEKMLIMYRRSGRHRKISVR